MTHVDAPFPTKQRKQKKPLPLWAETVVLLVVALGLAILIKAFFAQAFYIPSPSMNPGLLVNDRILVEKVSYWGGSPSRGDVVVFKDPGGWLTSAEADNPSNIVTKGLTEIGLYPSGGHLVKRVIGVGGDTVQCQTADGSVMVNGQALTESSYLPQGTTPCMGAGGGTWSVKVPDGYLWVMGDNRGDSSDSRAHLGSPGGGFVKADLVVGKAFALVWPLNRIKLIETPATFKAVPHAQ